MRTTRALVVAALLPAVLACSALGVCWTSFASRTGHGCCDQPTSTSLGSGSEPCASMVVGAAVPAVHAPEAWAAHPAVAGTRARSGALAALARVLPAKAPPLVLRI